MRYRTKENYILKKKDNSQSNKYKYIISTIQKSNKLSENIVQRKWYKA